MKPVYVRGMGLFTPGFDSPLAWCDQKEAPDLEKPEASILAGPLRRRATPLTRLAIEALVQATTASGSDLATIQSVWATAHGEHSPAIKMLAMMKTGEGRVSPTQFHNSVHNTAGGYASIASNNATRSTTLTGGSELVGSTLLEAFCLLDAHGGEVAVVLADEPLQAPFERSLTTASLSISLVLSHERAGAIGALKDLARTQTSGARLHERFGGLYVSAGLPLIESLVRGQPGTLPLELEGMNSGPIWTVRVENGV